jgi:hypothetical protein
MGFLSRGYYFFAPYTDARERAVGHFFAGLTEHSDEARTRARLAELLQRNIAVINLWTEYRYKGYRYLRKARRKQLYTNLQLIAEDFDRFYASRTFAAEAVVSHMRRLAPHATVDPEKAGLLQAMVDYFSPMRGKYEYRESSSFGRLLRDPAQDKLVGDCNQLVTLYIYLYSRHHNVQDLQVRVLPGHVALHYRGIDIETTNSTLANYDSREGNVLLPVEEIVSINLLDTTDSYLSKHEVAVEDVLQASRFAFILSHNRELVAHNLDAAYKRLVNNLLEHNNYSRALEFATASHDPALTGLVGHNGAVYEIEHHNYAAARHFAQHATGRDELIRSSWQAEGAHRYQARRYHDAIKAFEHAGDQTRVRQCYEALFFAEQAKLGSNLTTESIKQYAGVIKRMQAYARKSGNKGLIEHADSLNKHL